MKDPSGHGYTHAAVGGFLISPSDVSQLPFITRFIYVGSPGDVALMLLNGDILILTSPMMGMLLPLRVIKVFATGTTSGLIYGLY